MEDMETSVDMVEDTIEILTNDISNYSKLNLK